MIKYVIRIIQGSCCCRCRRGFVAAACSRRKHGFCVPSPPFEQLLACFRVNAPQWKLKGEYLRNCAMRQIVRLKFDLTKQIELCSVKEKKSWQSAHSHFERNSVEWRPIPSIKHESLSQIRNCICLASVSLLFLSNYNGNNLLAMLLSAKYGE